MVLGKCIGKADLHAARNQHLAELLSYADFGAKVDNWSRWAIAAKVVDRVAKQRRCQKECGPTRLRVGEHYSRVMPLTKRGARKPGARLVYGVRLAACVANVLEALFGPELSKQLVIAARQVYH
jgi:hypothetical protein